METLAADDAAANEALKDMGYPFDKRKEILNSGHGFSVRPLEKGERLYAFDSADWVGKEASSPYWMDEKTYLQVEKDFNHGGLWDRQGVKNYLALPCYNKADGLVRGVVKRSDALAVESTIGPATENVTYTALDGTVVPKALALPGGGAQLAPTPGSVDVAP